MTKYYGVKLNQDYYLGAKGRCDQVVDASDARLYKTMAGAQKAADKHRAAPWYSDAVAVRIL